MVYSTGDGVHGFTLDPDIGEFLLSHPNMSFPAQAHCYSANHAYFSHWPEGAKAFVRWLQGEDLPRMTERYTGSLVADFHRNLLLGGVFIYPADRKNPRGKLRLLYEAAPLAFLAEQARGYASNGHGSILEIVPQELHERTPFIVGNRSLVEKAEQLIRQGGKGAAH
jgi:fructose-1,6-bisphosphatase I